MTIEDNVRNKDTIQGWINRWYPLASHAVETLALFSEYTLEKTAEKVEPAGAAIDCYYRDYLQSMDLQVPS